MTEKNDQGVPLEEILDDIVHTEEPKEPEPKEVYFPEQKSRISLGRIISWGFAGIGLAACGAILYMNSLISTPRQNEPTAVVQTVNTEVLEELATVSTALPTYIQLASAITKKEYLD